MAWRAELPKGFDLRDCVFAGNGETEDAARKALAIAKREGCTEDDVAKEIVWHIKSYILAKNDPAFLSAQLQRLSDLWRNT